MGVKSKGRGRRETWEKRVLFDHKYTPRSSTWAVARKSAVGEKAREVAGDSNRKQSISLREEGGRERRAVILEVLCDKGKLLKS